MTMVLFVRRFLADYGRNPVNLLLILFVWIIDVFLGPAFGTAGKAATRVLPTHYVTLWMTGLRAGHAGVPGNLGWALLWTAGSAAAAWPW